MPTDSTTTYDVQLGAWTDWSRGRVFGATLTFTRQDGNLLIAFLAFFVALVGTRFWRLVCLILHHIYSKENPSDGLYHQRQVLLRNTPNPEAALVTIANMGFSWRRNARRVWARLLPLFGLAMACLTGSILAGGFSSRVATLVSSEVLLSGANCGFLGNNNNMSTYGDTVGSQMSESMVAAENYARQCYSSASVGVSCGTYVKKQLPLAVVDTNASCPFDARICNHTAGNLFIDTGLLDSHYDFGRNTPTNRRVQFRRTVHCAPLATEGYRFRTYDVAKNQSYTTYYYSPLENVNQSMTVNYTTQFSNNVYPDIEELTHNGGDTVHDFSVRYHYSLHWNGSIDPDYSSFFPIPELTPQNASLFIFFLTSGALLFTHPSTDSWYGGTTNTTEIHKLKISDWGNATMFRQSEPGSPLACKELEQYCYSGVKGQRKCTPLESLSNSMVDFADLLDEEDKAWISWLFMTTFNIAVGTRIPLSLLGTHVLMARNKLNGPLLGSLPENQWQLEVQHWHATAMAHLQAAFLESIIGFKDPKFSPLIRYPNTTIERDLCANQKILAEGFVSVSIFGLICIFVGGGLIIILSFTLSPMLSCYLPRVKNYRYSTLEWSVNDTFQQQRLAHEATGLSTWSGGTESVPVTTPGDLLAALDIADPTHPKLRTMAIDSHQTSPPSEDEDAEKKP
ncbi:hypothetical protein N431DRAFT_355340 [Stipitochalara longipes BDJ]|nr:hypothetical protein N431DRAFT_355340 [Stipitochalara longipes BDJ]